MGTNIDTIDLRVEMDITSVTYSILGPRSIGAPVIIFAVELSRPTTWAKNGGKCLPPLHPGTYSLLYPSDKVWKGQIGVIIDNHPPWSSTTPP